MRGGFLGIASVHLTLQCELPALPGHEDKAGFDPLGCGHPGKCTKKKCPLCPRNVMYWFHVYSGVLSCVVILESFVTVHQCAYSACQVVVPGCDC